MDLPGISSVDRLGGEVSDVSQDAKNYRGALNPIAMRAASLVDLVEGRLEVEAEVGGHETAWEIVGPALLVHATSSLRSIVFRLGPEGAHNDASRLLRSLYDHIVTFAWLAVDPSGRLETWRKEDLIERLKIDREFADAGVQLLSDADRTQMERDIDGIEGNAPKLADKALSADRYWVPRIDALKPQSLHSFRGFYTLLFRQHSGLVHATMRGLNHVTIDVPPSRQRVVLEGPLGESSPYSMATVVYGLGLLVAAQSLSWPDANEIEAVFARFM